MPRDANPTLNLGQVWDLIHSSDAQSGLFHIFGIFRKELLVTTQPHWVLWDENKEINIRLAGAQTEYPRPKPGDVVRIHRLRVNQTLKCAEITMARNVLIWPAFQFDPKPTGVARNPTVKDTDRTRRRILESYFCTRVTKLNDILTSRLVDIVYDNIAGRCESTSTDPYGHLEILFTDGTGSTTLRVFCKSSYKNNPIEDDAHFKIASQMKKGQYFVASNVKFDSHKRLNLSANLLHGRSLRIVESDSILGQKLADQLAVNAPRAESGSTINGSQNEPRRSPRFAHLDQVQDDNNTQQTQSSQVVVQEIRNPVAPEMSEPIPKYTQYSDIQRRDSYEFYNLVGQVRDQPRITSDDFGNCVLQIFDGSLHEFDNYYAPLVEHPLEGCLIVLIYSKQKESDTNEHCDKARALREGDIIHLINVKVSFRDGKIKPELQANKFHGKSINVIDKQSLFGRKILKGAETPQVAELRDMIDPVTDDSFESSENGFLDIDPTVGDDSD